MGRLTALGCYIFQGSFSLGVQKYFDILATLENGEFGEATTRLNFDHEIHNVQEEWPIKRYAGKVDLMYGNPPCAPFSPMGSGMKGKDGWRTDARIQCWTNLVEAAIEIQPKVFVGESVPKFYTNGFELVSSYAKDLVAAGYPRIYVVLHDIKFMGAAQQRRRVFLVASKYDLQWTVPNTPMVTLRQALASLDGPGPYKELYDEFVEMYHTVPPGGGLKKAFDEFYTPEFVEEHGLRKPRFVAHKANWDAPTGTVFGHTVLTHPDEARYFGVAELSRMMGYPDGYKWAQEPDFDMNDKKKLHGALARQGSEMVKAVTSFAAEYAAKTVADAIHSSRAPWSMRATPRVMEIKRWASNTRVINYDMVAEDRDISEEVLG